VVKAKKARTVREKGDADFGVIRQAIGTGTVRAMCADQPGGSFRDRSLRKQLAPDARQRDEGRS
jgi:hypothetical protein